MKHFMDSVQRDEDGRLLLGNPHKGCGFCGAEPEPTYSGCGRVVWWHAPFDCCKDRRHHQAMADRAHEREAAQERARAAHLGWVASQREYAP